MTWPAEFERTYGRRPRVLHVGNVGNNAYLNARFLRSAGVECDVVDLNTTALATPEWEGHERPSWYVQAPLVDAVRQLSARDGVASAPGGARRRSPDWRWRARLTASAVKRRLLREPATADEARVLAAFDAAFPNRADRLTLDDVRRFGGIDVWRSLFALYDIVQAYATYPLHALLADSHPYVAYEHGTLRTFAFGDDPLSRLTALAYRESDHTFVTNGDVLEHARELGIPRFSPMIHPLDVEQHERDRSAEAAAIRRRYGADVLLFCPMRHDWEIKGTDVHLRALPELASRVPGRVLLLLCRWGGDVGRAESLIDRLGIRERVAWLEPMPREPFIAHLKAADVLLEQMTLPHFDATIPQALAAGTPAVMSYRPESTAWIVPEPAPIGSAFDADEVVDAVVQALDAEWRREFERRAADWINEHHHPDRLVAEHLRVYERLLRNGVETRP